jgi:MFS transporter, ACS family, tartrate transporter
VALVGAGSYGALGPFWTIPRETLPHGVSGSAMGLINALGNLGGYFGPVVVGAVTQRTGNFRAAFVILGLGWVVGAGLTRLLRRNPRRVNSSEAQ